MMNSHFSGYRCIHTMQDTSRHRTMRVFEVEEEAVVGVSDGIDAWMVPISNSMGGVAVRTMLLNSKPDEGENKRARKRLVEEQTTQAPATSPDRGSRPRKTLLV